MFVLFATPRELLIASFLLGALLAFVLVVAADVLDGAPMLEAIN